jgi:nitrogen fixation/metabolism regulation signal transduction histidine kinase
LLNLTVVVYNWDGLTNTSISGVSIYNISTGAIIAQTTTHDEVLKHFNSIKRKSKPSWSTAIVSGICAHVGLQCPVFVIFTYPIFNMTRNFTDYMGSSAMAASSLSNDLNNIASSMSDCVIIIIEKRTGSIIASSDLATSTIINSTLATGLNYNNNLVQSSTAHLRAQYGDYYEQIEAGSGQGFQYFDSTNQVIYVNFNLVEDDFGIKWIAVVAVPQSSLSGQQIGNIIIMSVFSFLAIVLCLIIGLTSSMMILRPLYLLMSKMKLVEQFELEFMQGYRLSIFTEVRAIQTAFGIMCEKLKEYKAFLPSSVI